MTISYGHVLLGPGNKKGNFNFPFPPAFGSQAPCSGYTAFSYPLWLRTLQTLSYGRLVDQHFPVLNVFTHRAIEHKQSASGRSQVHNAIGIFTIQGILIPVLYKAQGYENVYALLTIWMSAAESLTRAIQYLLIVISMGVDLYTFVSARQ